MKSHLWVPGLFSAVLAAVVACSSAPKPALSGSARGSEASASSSGVTGDKGVPAAGDLTSPLGAPVTLPPGWTAERIASAVLIQDPDKELKLWMVDLKDSSGAAAIAAAWLQVDPSFSREAADVVSPPIMQGWDTIVQTIYTVAPEEARLVAGIARSKGGIAYVVLIDSPLAALGRRNAQVGQIIDSQKAPGLKSESFAGRTAKSLDGERAAAFESFIVDALAKTRVPGAAIAVVQGGKVIFEKGYGVRRLGRAEKVTPDTAFMIGSTTKSLTSLMMATLVERGLFSWSTALQKVLPSFALADPDVAAKVEMQHSVCACTGLPRQDMEFVFEFKGVTPEARLAQLATMKPTTGFGETFQYSNALVSAGGFAAAHAAHPTKTLSAAYATTMQEAVFGPLGMKRTTFDRKAVAKGNHATPHGAQLDGTFREIPLSYEEVVASVAPAGGAWSTVGDLARYLQLELAKGVLPDGKIFLPEDALMVRQKPMVQIGEKSAYALALMVSRQADLLSVGHNGNTMGFSALMTFWPEHDLGVVILSNGQGTNSFTGMVERRLLELVLDGEQLAEKSLDFAVARRDESIAKALPKLTLEHEADWTAKVVGRYRNDALGELKVFRDKKGYVVDAGEWKTSAFKYTDAGQSTLMLTGAPMAGVQFQVKDDKSLLLDVGQQQYVFRRLP